jgi:hypothetical protein
MNKEFMLQILVTGGGAGIYGDMMYNQSVKYGGGLLESVAGPGITTIAELADLLTGERMGLMGGEDRASATNWARFAKSNTPLQNLFYTKQVTDYLIWYHLLEASNPGYLRRMERRFEREGQEFLMKPSETIARGGFAFQ